MINSRNLIYTNILDLDQQAVSYGLENSLY